LRQQGEVDEENMVWKTWTGNAWKVGWLPPMPSTDSFPKMSACSWIVHQKASEQEKKNHHNQVRILVHELSSKLNCGRTENS
jgi:hypothetical protein